MHVCTHRCACGNCAAMSTAAENRCCHSYAQIRGLMLPSQACISEHPGFEGNCLNPWVLEASVYEFVFEDGPLGDDQPINE